MSFLIEGRYIMNDQENQAVTGRLLEQIDRQSEIIVYLLGKNERLRSQLRDLEQSSESGAGKLFPDDLASRRL
jgi:hypothetical protein